MRYDKNGLPIKEYYTEELKKSSQDKIKALSEILSFNLIDFEENKTVQ